MLDSEAKAPSAPLLGGDVLGSRERVVPGEFSLCSALLSTRLNLIVKSGNAAAAAKDLEAERIEPQASKVRWLAEE